MDIMGNIGWFMIFGYLLHYWMNENSSPFRSIATVVLIGLTVSLTLELLQAFYHNHHPSMTDVICDSVGACLDAYFSEQHRTTVFSEPVRYMVIEDNSSKTLL